MRKLIGLILIGLAFQACSMTGRGDAENALFTALFDVPRGSCRQVRAELEAEIDGLKAAKKQADDAFLAEQEAPAKEAKPPRSSGKGDSLGALREWAKRSERAEKWNAALKERNCRTVDLEAALK
jgi:hypothetical protein